MSVVSLVTNANKTPRTAKWNPFEKCILYMLSSDACYRCASVLFSNYHESAFVRSLCIVSICTSPWLYSPSLPSTASLSFYYIPQHFHYDSPTIIFICYILWLLFQFLVVGFWKDFPLVVHKFISPSVQRSRTICDAGKKPKCFWKK